MIEIIEAETNENECNNNNNNNKEKLLLNENNNNNNYELSSSSTINNEHEIMNISHLKSPKIIDSLTTTTTNIHPQQTSNINCSQQVIKTKRRSNNENLNSKLVIQTNNDQQQQQALIEDKKLKVFKMNTFNNSFNNLSNSNEMIKSDENNESDENEPIDPRVQIELERLNKSMSDINNLENELDEAKQLFINTKNRQSQRLEYLQKKFGSCIIKAKPYFDTLQITEKLQKETQKAVQEFQKACGHHNAAKETLAVAEKTLSSNGISDVWQEYLSETITKINNSKKLADMAGEYHKSKMLEYQMSEKRLQFLEDDLKRNIAKSRSYYEEKDRWQIQMESQKSRINELERALNDSKRVYSDAMNALRRINEEIHLSRHTKKMCLKQREPCIGAEKPEKFYDKQESFISASKSLENLSKHLDSTDDNNSEECASLDATSLNERKSLTEKRFSYQNKQRTLTEYYSFGATVSEPSSRSSSPTTNQQIDSDKLSESRIIIGESNENITSDNTDAHNSEYNNVNKKSQQDTNSEKLCVDKITATNIIASNPKINKSSSLYFSNLNSKMDESKNRLPTVPPSSKAALLNTSKVKQETPLLTNLLLYSSAITKISNSKSNDNNQRTNKL